jgi:hypothetical protein
MEIAQLVYFACGIKATEFFIDETLHIHTHAHKHTHTYIYKFDCACVELCRKFVEILGLEMLTHIRRLYCVGSNNLIGVAPFSILRCGGPAEL